MNRRGVLVREAKRRLGFDPARPVVGRLGRADDLKWRRLLVSMLPALLGESAGAAALRTWIAGESAELATRAAPGLGRRLIEFAEAEARRLGYAELRLYTHEKMVENIALYGRLGFEEIGRGREAGYDRVFMTKRLA